MNVTTLTANRDLDGNIVNTRYWKVGSASTVSSNANTDLYIGETSGYTNRRSRIIFYPESSIFTNKTITKITLTVKVKDLFSGSDKTANTAIRYSSINANTDEAYKNAAYFNDVALTTPNETYNIEITDSAILNNISSWCKNGTPFSFYFGKGTNDSIKAYGLQLYGYSDAGAPTLKIEHTPSASTGTISSNPTIGSKFTVNIARASSEYTHKIIIQSNIDSAETINSGKITKTSWSPTISEEDTYKWITNGASSQAKTKLIIETYLGDSLLGKNEYYFTLYAKTKPTVSWPNDDNFNTINADSGNLKGILMSGYGKITLKLKATPIDEVSSISYFRVKINSCNVVVDKKYTATNNSVTINDLPKPYTTSNTTFSINVYAINNRGKESVPNTISTTCYAYALPSLSNLKIIRASNTSGTEDLMGSYIYGTSNIAISSNGGNTFKSISVSIKDSNLTPNINTSNPLKFYIAGASAEKEYTITINVTDQVATNTITTKIPSSNFVLHVKTGGKSIGIGSAAGKDGTIKLGWKLLVNNGIEFYNTKGEFTPLPVSSGGTGVSSMESLKTSLGINNYLPLSGGTMTGPLASQIYRLYYEDNGEALNVINYNTIDSEKDLRGKNIHRVFLGATNQRVFIVSGTDPKFYMRNFLANETVDKDGEKIYTFLHTGNYNNYTESYYPIGSEITLNNGILFGYSTNDAKEIRILISLPKSLAKIDSVKFDNFECAIRDGTGYAIQKSWSNGTAIQDYVNFINMTETKVLKEQRAVFVQLDVSKTNSGLSSWYLENNRTLSVQPSNIKFTLN